MVHLGTHALLVLFVALGTLCIARAQEASDAGTVSGIVVEAGLGRPIAGVTVLVRGLTLATTTDVEGRYTLRGVPTGVQTLTFSKSGYVRGIVTEIRVAPGQVSKVDVPLRPEYYEMEEFEVTAEELKEQEVELLSSRQRAAAISDAIGSDAFSRYASSDAADIMAKVSGTSVVDGKFAVIRGLSDRYTSATLNGAEIPSADPYRKSVQLDLFPAGQIDRVVVSKTFTPDQPGSFTGGNINIVTKSFPEKPFFKFSVGTSYNTQANLNDDFRVAPEASADAFSIGRDMQDVSGPLKNPNALSPSGPLGDPRSHPQRNSSRRETLDEAIARREQANHLQRLTQALGPTGFEPKKDTSPLNSDFSFETGTTTTNLIKGRKLGMFSSGNYGRSFAMYENGVANRLTADQSPKRFMSDTRARMNTDYGGSVALALELNEQHTIRFNTLVNQNIEDEARTQIGRDFLGGSSDPLLMHHLHYTERQLQAYQLNGIHTIPQWNDNRIEWIGSHVITSQDEPDYRFFHANVSPDGSYQIGGAGLPQPNNPSRFFRNIEENNYTARLDDTQPFKWWRGLAGELKGGFYYSTSERTLDERTFSYLSDSGGTYNGAINDYLSPQYLRYLATHVSGTRTNFNFPRYITSEFGNNNSDGSLEIYAGYLMTDAPLTSWLRFIGGVRYETTLYNVSGLSRDATTPESAVIDAADVLPAVGLVFNVVTNMNVRLNFAQTIARPSFREISPGNTYDPTTDDLFVGNPDLQISHINNYDLRWEWFRRPGELIAWSVFYKQIDMPIERRILDLNADKSTYENRESAILYGMEFEARTRLDFIDELFKNFSVGANIAYIQSEVELTPEELANKRRIDPGVDETRPLYDQSPYIINLDLSYDNPKSGTLVTLVANLTAERIFITNPAGPDVYEHPPTMLDLVIQQKLGKHWKLKLSAKNLLDPEVTRTYGSDPNGLLYSSYKRGRTFGISLSAEF